VSLRVLVLEPVHPALPRLLLDCGVEVVEAKARSRDELLRLLPGYDAVVVRGRVRLDAELIEAGARGRLRVIARAGVGLDNIDVDAARRLGVKVVNAPSASSQSVAELTIALMVAAARSILAAASSAKAGRWERTVGTELYGKTLLIVGLGRIGRRVAVIAKAMGMRVYAYDVADVSEAARRIGVELVDDLCKGLSIADVVSLHVPLDETTYHMMGRRELMECLKPGAVLVNTARGAVVDPEALLEALEAGRVAAAALDVLETEPPSTEVERRLVSHPRVIVTPHIGASTREAQYRVAVQTAYRLAKALGVECEAVARAYDEVCRVLRSQDLEC
jgi:D-3-phosphoglycerate dehydrogenase